MPLPRRYRKYKREAKARTRLQFGPQDRALSLLADETTRAFNDTVSATAGYRHLEVDYSNGGFDFDVELSGPVIGATIRF